jgi:hypothetical protein
MSVATVVAVTVAVALFPLAETKAPGGLLRSTPVKDTAPATIEALVLTVTAMVLVPLAGESRYHMSVR